MSDTFRILVVCTGNICRSAQAERLIRARVAEYFPELASVVVVESAGTGALVGSGMPSEAAASTARYGADAGDHVARQLTAEQIKGADLVLAMAAEHRSAVVRLVPRASRNVFMLTEFAALLESAEENHPAPSPDLAPLTAVERLRSAVTWASTRKGYLRADEAAPVDVVDPYRRSEEIYAESARQIVEALDRIQRTAVNLTRQGRV